LAEAAAFWNQWAFFEPEKVIFCRLEAVAAAESGNLTVWHLSLRKQIRFAGLEAAPNPQTGAFATSRRSEIGISVVSRSQGRICDALVVRRMIRLVAALQKKEFALSEISGNREACETK